MKQLKNIFSLLIAILFIVSCNDDEIIPKVKLSTEAVNPSSYGASDGAINLTIEGLEDTPYEIFWSNGENTKDISGLVAGNYSVKVIYLDKAVANKSVVLTEPGAAPLNLNFDVTMPSKWGYSNGSVLLQVNNGVEPFLYEWSNGSTEQNLKNLKSGIYSVTVTDSNPHKPVVTSGSVMVGQPEFVCGVDSLIDVDGFKYPTVMIGEQCWTTVNIKTVHKPGWDPNDKSLIEEDYLIEGRYCDGIKCNTALGAHYTWEATVNSEHSDGVVQGIAPKGWHIPGRAEWKTMNDWLKIAGNGGDGTNVPNKIRGENSSSGFNVLYAGNWGYGVFTGDIGVFWTSTEYLDVDGNSTGEAYYRLVNPLPLFGEGHDILEKGLSVRLVKDK